MRPSSKDSLILLGGDDYVVKMIFDNWSLVKTRYQYYLATKNQRDNIPWPKLETDYTPQSRITEFFYQCDNQNTLGILGMVIKEKFPRTFDVVSKSQAGYLFKPAVQRTQQTFGPVCVKMFQNASPDDFGRIALAFGLMGNVSHKMIDICAELTAQGLMGYDVDMTYAISVFKDVYRPAYIALAEYMGVSIESDIPNIHSSVQNFVQENKSLPDMEFDPLAAAISQQTAAKAQNVAFFLTSEDFKHYRTMICSVMDEAHAWEALLEKRGLLGGEGMEKFVAKHKSQWENGRRGEPTMSVLITIVKKDREFASMDLPSFATLLNSLNIRNADDKIRLQTEVTKLTSWLDAEASKKQKKSQASYTAQFDLRKWLLQNNVCEETEVDRFLPRLREEGAKSIESLRAFDKSDLKSCGFNIVQCNAILTALKR